MRRLACVIVAIAGCHSAPAPQAPAAPPPPPAPAPAPAPARVPPLDLSDPLALAPANTDVFIVLDFAALRQSKLWASYANEMYALFAPGLVGCGYNLFDHLTTVTGGVSEAEPNFPMVVRGIDRDSTLACLKASKIETRTAATIDADNVVTLTNTSGSVNLAKFVDATTLVLYGSKNPTKQGLEASLGNGAPLRRDPELVAALDRIPHGAALALIARRGSTVLKSMSDKVGAPTRGFQASLSLTDHIEAQILVQLTSKDDAQAMVDAMRPQLVGLKQYVDRYDARASGDTAIIEIAASAAQVRQFVDLVKAAWAQKYGQSP